MNPDVKGDYVEEDVSQILERNPQFFTEFSVVIASLLNVPTLKKLGALLWKHEIPLVICLSYGFLGKYKWGFFILVFVSGSNVLL